MATVAAETEPEPAAPPSAAPGVKSALPPTAVELVAPPGVESALPPTAVELVAPPGVESALPPTAVAPPLLPRPSPSPLLSVTTPLLSVTTVAPATATKPATVDTTALVALLGYDAGVMIGLLPEVSRVGTTWNGAAQVVFAALFFAVIGLFVPVAIIIVFNKRMLSAAAVYAKASSVILTGLFVVAVATHFGHWGNMAALPAGIFVTGLMTGVWIRTAGEKGEEMGEEEMEEHESLV